MKKAVKKSTKKAKKSFSLKEKLIMLICCVTITGSGVTIATYAAMTWDAPAGINGDLLATEIGTVDGSVEAYAPGRPPTDCCGTANRTFGCNENSFTSTTTTSTIGVFCKPPAIRSKFPKVINFPNPGETAKWNCICKNADGTPIIGSDGKQVVSSCSASRKSPGKCSGDVGKTIILDNEKYKNLFYDNDYDSLQWEELSNNDFYSSLCSGGKFKMIQAQFESLEKRPNGCAIIYYKCPCDDATFVADFVDSCRVDYCGAQPTNRKCGDTMLDQYLGEECEINKYGYGNFYGKTCANSSSKGACGELKCNKCKVDDSGCYPCPPISDGVFTD